MVMLQPIKWVGGLSGHIRIIDQTALPLTLRYIDIRSTRVLHAAIRRLSVRGAPAIGVAGAFGIVLAAARDKSSSGRGLVGRMEAEARFLASSRPTAVNLFWALDRMVAAARSCREMPAQSIRKVMLREALAIFDEDRRTCELLGRHGAKLIRNNSTLLTHCNAGALATAGTGTALACFYTAAKNGKHIRVFCDETRPLLQGARLTAWELQKSGIDATLICDNMAGSLMAQGRIDAVFTGADRIAANGDSANKIGTYSLAVLARAHGIPFYIVAPLSTFDPSLKSGSQIPIEQRSADEVTTIGNSRIAPQGIRVYNPAFDVTPARCISAIVTEKGLLLPPYRRSIERVFAG
jgi:methylthioribose-1-phosphate isomerase